MPDKLIVTNHTALRAKYGAKYKAITEALKTLVAADAKRGLKTMVVGLDDSSAVTPAVKSAGNAEQAKKAIDALYKKYGPDYVMILGAPDVVPHVKLRNLLFDPSGEGDDDRTAPSDLPYACETPYSTKISDFLGPTRVVGRLPDIDGAKDPEYLVDLLKTAASWKERPASDYTKYFGITANVWKASTAMSLRKTFGDDDELQRIPPEDENWPAPLLKRMAHFINCHGSPHDPQFYGQRDDDDDTFPVSMNAGLIEGKIVEGTIAAAECCYGGELYNPSATHQHMGIGTTYLGGKAYCYLGSSTIAYGPASGNGSADLICQFFLRNILAGASTGRALLEARQKFITGSGDTSPTDLKTIAQFMLLGDPSVQPVQAAAPHAIKTRARIDRAAPKAARVERRRRLFIRGCELAETQSYAKPVGKPAPAMTKKMRTLARASGVTPVKTLSFEVTKPPAAKSLTRAMPKGIRAKTAEKLHYYVSFGKRKNSHDLARGVAIVAKSANGTIVQSQELYLKG